MEKCEICHQYPKEKDSRLCKSCKGVMEHIVKNKKEYLVKNVDIEYLDPLSDKQKEAIFDVEINYLTENEIKENYGKISKLYRRK